MHCFVSRGGGLKTWSIIASEVLQNSFQTSCNQGDQQSSGLLYSSMTEQVHFGAPPPGTSPKEVGLTDYLT